MHAMPILAAQSRASCQGSTAFGPFVAVDNGAPVNERDSCFIVAVNYHGSVADIHVFPGASSQKQACHRSQKPFLESTISSLSGFRPALLVQLGILFLSVPWAGEMC